MRGGRLVDRRDAELKAAVKRGQVQADLFTTVRVLARVAGAATVGLAAAATLLGYAGLWILVPNVASGRWLVGVLAALLALGGIGALWTGLRLCVRVRDMATLRARMAATARLSLLLGLPGLALLVLLMAAGARGATILTPGWVAVQLLLAPLGLAAALACGTAATPGDRHAHPAAREATPRTPGPRIALAIAFGLALLPALLPDGLSLWPHRPLPGDPQAAVTALEARHRWETSWRFRLCQAVPWGRFVRQVTPTGLFPELDVVVMTPKHAQQAFEDIARAAVDDADQRELLLGLIASPTVPVRMRATAIDKCWVFGTLPQDVEIVLADICTRPEVAMTADLRDWYGQHWSTEPPLIGAENALRKRAIEVLLATRTRTPRVIAALRTLRHHPTLDIWVRAVLDELDPHGGR